MEANESVLRAGYRLDRYELLCPIATGGMATVWLAQLRGKRGFEKLFAVKTIRTELVDDPQFEEMFLDEARIASGIQHANVAQILDLGEQEDVLFIVMEWVDGDSLAKIRKLLSKRKVRLPIAIVLRVLADACAGLHAAHELRDERGEPIEIVHRDVSPHNLLLSTSGAVKVIDFGIAKAQNRRQGETRTGIVKGKIQYMAPEQVNKGATVDRRADVWALGMCLHELALGKLPYDGGDDVDVIRKLMGKEPPVIAADAPPAIARILDRSIALDPDARFPTAAGMQRALESVMKELGESASSEDVAAFLRAELPDLARRRREAVSKAIEEARERGTLATESRDDVAFAPTLVGERGARAPAPAEVRAIALTKRKGSAGREDSQVTPSTALDQGPIPAPSRSRAWMWASLVCLVGAGGSIVVWPIVAEPLLGVIGRASSPASPGPAERHPPAAPAATVKGEGRPPAVADSAAAASPPPSETASGWSAGGRRAGDTTVSDATATHVEVARAPSNPIAAPSGVPSAPTAGEDASGAPVQRVPPSPVAAPSATEDDPNNPYND